MDYTAMRRALRECVKLLGTGILTDSRKFKAAINDMLPGFAYEQERSLLCFAADNLQLGKRMLQHNSAGSSDCERIYNYLLGEIGQSGILTEEAAEGILQAFAYALGWELTGLADGCSSSSPEKDSRAPESVNEPLQYDGSASVQGAGPELLNHVPPADKTDSKIKLVCFVIAAVLFVAIAIAFHYDSEGAKRQSAGSPSALPAAEQLASFERGLRLAEQGDAEAQKNLAVRYHKGDGVPRDLTEAVKWYRKAAEQGNADAQNLLGWCYQFGESVPQDYGEAVKWYRQSADQGNSDAQCSLAGCYLDGKGVSKDLTEAARWYRKSAEQGNARGQRFLGCCYREGLGVSRDDSEAAKWFRKAAEQGDSDAQCFLGRCYDDGIGVSRNMTEAVKWYRMSAEQGNADAQFILGCCYYGGDGVPQDAAEAAKLYRKAAEQGDSYAQCFLGGCYDEGDGVPQDKTEAVKWYRKSAEQGNETAQKKLRILREKGFM
ncbi:sel1 repeat family protein [bacterium]|nr:sel1 repeat family protein [bacterium]